jgi:uracil-DNA glycosylase
MPMKSERKSDDFKNLAEVYREIAACRACSLCETRNNTVPGEGADDAGLMFIGEAPGAEEDSTGRPFVGRAGQLLTKILESVSITREEVFIGNILKCRPPNNRDPKPEESAACSRFILAQIRLIRPRIIVCLGRISAQFLTGGELEGITRIHGNWYDFDENTVLMPVYHPSYLLRNPSREKGSIKWQMWQDIKEVKRVYEERQGKRALEIGASHDASIRES